MPSASNCTVSDGVRFVVFSITGGLVGIEEGLHFFGVITVSLLTATGGGIVGDLLVNEVPMVLRADFYDTIALLLGVAIYLLYRADRVNLLTHSVLFAMGLILRLGAYIYQWHLPKKGLQKPQLKRTGIATLMKFYVEE